jgi:hypothetical protein
MKLCQEISDATKIEIVQVSGIPDFTFPTLCSLLMCATYDIKKHPREACWEGD